jgi:arsenate reductase
LEWSRIEKGPIKENPMAEKIVIYQKPTCSKCRATLALLKNSGEEFDAVNYYEVSLTPERLRELIDKLGVPVRDILRSDEPLARELKLRERELSDEGLIKIMVENPDLIQRPIVVRGEKAVLCRPPENVMKLL